MADQDRGPDADLTPEPDDPRDEDEDLAPDAAAVDLPAPAADPGDAESPEADAGEVDPPPGASVANHGANTSAEEVASGATVDAGGPVPQGTSAAAAPRESTQRVGGAQGRTVGTGAPRRPRLLPKSPADRLFAEPHAFRFFQAVRLMARLLPDRRPVGEGSPPRSEIVRFRSRPSLEFPPCEIHEIRESDDGDDRPPEMTVAFFGLIGLNGGLPHHYTELVRERMSRHKDRTLRDFLDLFDHRLLSLFFRAWEKNRFWVAAENALHAERREARRSPARLRAFLQDSRPQVDRVGQILLDLTGTGIFGLRYDARVRHVPAPRTAIADDVLRYFAGLFSQRHRSAAGLQCLLAGYFRLPVEVEPLRGRWLRIDEQDRSRLGDRITGRLGRTTVSGARVWDVQSSFRVRFGPLTFDRFRELLPPGSAHAPATDLVRLFAGTTFDFDVELVLKAEEVPQMRLGGGADGARLGWTSWCRREPSAAADASVVLAVRDDREPWTTGDS